MITLTSDGYSISPTNASLSGQSYLELPLAMPEVGGDLPTDWWDEDADKSLIMGVFKHGYEKYREIRYVCYVTTIICKCCYMITG